MYADPPVHAVREAVARAIAEDLTPIGDVTSALLDPTLIASCHMVAREAGRLAGVACAIEAFRQVDPDIAVEVLLHDGDELVAGQRLAAVSGPLASILTAERTALNFLQTLSGTATATRRYVDAIAGTGCAILDTRKTLPGLRLAQEYARRNRAIMLALVCRALADDCVASLPIKKKNTRMSRETHAVAAIRRGRRWLVVQRPESGLWGGLWELPTVIADGQPIRRIVRRLAADWTSTRCARPSLRARACCWSMRRTTPPVGR